jgi:integrase
MAHERFQITQFDNPGGSVSWRVDGRRPDGSRVRENYPNFSDAASRKEELESEALNQTVAVRLRRTRLSDAMLQDAEAAYQKLVDAQALKPHLNGKNLLTAVEFLVERYRGPSQSPKTKDAALEFLEAKKVKGLRPRTIPQLRHNIGLLTQQTADKPVGENSYEDIRAAVFKDGENLEPRTLNHRINNLRQFFRWCIRRKYCAEDPTVGIETFALDDKEPEIFTVEKVVALLIAARDFKKGRLLPRMVIEFFGGLRPAELGRCSPKDLSLGNAPVIRMKGKQAKRRKRRAVDISPNLAAWLNATNGAPFKTPSFRKDFDQVRRRAGFRGSFAKPGDEKLLPWIYDGIRHTAISAHLAYHEDENKTALWAGTSPDMIYEHYNGVMDPEEAKLFWSISPDNIDEIARQLQLPQAVKSETANATQSEPSSVCAAVAGAGNNTALAQ